MQGKSRPKFLNLLMIAPRMSITAKVSILHRLTGVLLFISIPFLLNILDRSLTNSDFYSVLYGYVSSPFIKLVYLILIWAFMYHACSGVRFLFLDIHKGVELRQAKITSYVVIVISLILTAILGVLIW